MWTVLLMSMMALARQEKAHVHGQIHMNFAVEGKSGKIEMNLPTSLVYGFEYTPKSAKDKKAKDQGLQKLEDKISSMVVFDESLKCHIKKEIFEINQRDSHSDLNAEFSFSCEKSPMGTSVTMNMGTVFPRIKTVHVDVIGEGVQKSQEIQKDGESIDLKPKTD
ncbi:MAG TPA: DUF2796 domain-containing protein [Bdellovibrio sp.]|nr:DUF2796 domain-containing protein [Bdellovibrio sp.]